LKISRSSHSLATPSAGPKHRKVTPCRDIPKAAARQSRNDTTPLSFSSPLDFPFRFRLCHPPYTASLYEPRVPNVQHRNRDAYPSVAVHTTNLPLAPPPRARSGASAPGSYPYYGAQIDLSRDPCPIAWSATLFNIGPNTPLVSPATGESSNAANRARSAPLPSTARRLKPRLLGTKTKELLGLVAPTVLLSDHGISCPLSSARARAGGSPRQGGRGREDCQGLGAGGFHYPPAGTPRFCSNEGGSRPLT